MTHAQRVARVCRIAALCLTGCATYGACLHWLYALPGVIAAAVFLTVALSYESEDRRIRARHERARRAALVAEVLRRPDPWEQLNTGCCERWWTSLGAEHDTACPTVTARRRAA